MDEDQKRLAIISLITFLVFTLFAFAGSHAYGDVIFIGGSADMERVEEELTTARAVISGELDPSLAVPLDGEEFAGDASLKEEPTPMALFVSLFREKSRNAGVRIDSALREIASANMGSENQWPLALVGLLFLMLMVRFRRRARKSRFS